MAKSRTSERLSTTTDKRVANILSELRSLGSEKNRAGMARYHPRYLNRHDARRSRSLASFGLRNQRSNTGVCSAPVLDQASPATGPHGRAGLKALAMEVLGWAGLRG